ncbi:GNAT family protein [Nocardioides sp. 503]|uniref:GNAT family N-acetyltransferase n=1 Tax=Nocardioides sp. 503 TaxID=2508326 RepID=UPI0010705D71|nr:GNAT family protein [Nocardioides sp. 503]
MPELNEFDQYVGDPVPGWAPRPPATAVRLEGRHVTLEPLAREHAPALFEALGAPEDRPLWTYRPTEQPVDVAGMEALVEATLAAPGTETMVLRPASGPAAGVASFMRIDPGFGQVEVAGVLYARSLQRTTAATEAIHLLMRHAFDTLGYRRFEWKCDSLNEPSRRAAARLGFVHEGRFRNHMVTKGRSRDTDWFSVTDAEWPAVREAHERWLAPENFDASGRQRTALGDLWQGR